MPIQDRRSSNDEVKADGFFKPIEADEKDSK